MNTLNINRHFLIFAVALFFLMTQGCVQNSVTDQASQRLTSTQLIELKQSAGKLIAAGDYWAAKDILEQVVAEDKSDQAVQNALGICAMKVGDYPLSSWAFGKAITLSPDSYEARNNLGILYEKMGKLTKAVEEYQEAYQRSDASIEILGNMTRTQVKLGQRTVKVLEQLQSIQMNHSKESWRKWAIREQVKISSANREQE